VLAIRARQVFDGRRVTAGAGVVFVDNGRIIGIESATAHIPQGCRVLDHPTTTVLPGLIDTHVHLLADSGPGALDRLAEYSVEDCDRVIEQTLRVNLSAGVTTVRDLGDRNNAVVDWRSKHASTLAPTIVAAEPPITTPQGHCANMGGAAAGPVALRAAVRERVARGADLIKIMASGGAMTAGTSMTRGQYSVEDMATVVAEAHDAGLTVTAHAHPLAATRAAIAAGVDGIEHCTFMTDAGMDFAPDVIAMLAERQIAVCPTLGSLGANLPPQLMDILLLSGLTQETRYQKIAAFEGAHGHQRWGPTGLPGVIEVPAGRGVAQLHDGHDVQAEHDRGSCTGPPLAAGPSRRRETLPRGTVPRRVRRPGCGRQPGCGRPSAGASAAGGGRGRAGRLRSRCALRRDDRRRRCPPRRAQHPDDGAD
jgi:hypothetical protein